MHDSCSQAEFLIDASGTVRWADRTENYWARTGPETVLRLFEKN